MRQFISCLMIAFCLIAGPAFAKNNKHGNGHGRNDIVWDKSDRGDTNVDIRISLGDRQVIRDYLGRDARKNCPPGLAKKHNGCLPPGQAKKYRVGYPLDSDVGIAALPAAILNTLNPPRGYYYGRVDNDVVLISRENRLIVDAVSLLLGQ